MTHHSQTKLHISLLHEDIWSAQEIPVTIFKLDNNTNTSNLPVTYAQYHNRSDDVTVWLNKYKYTERLYYIIL